IVSPRSKHFSISESAFKVSSYSRKNALFCFANLIILVFQRQTNAQTVIQLEFFTQQQVTRRASLVSNQTVTSGVNGFSQSYQVGTERPSVTTDNAIFSFEVHVTQSASKLLL